MLTEIEWWGGLVIIWAALTLRYLTQESEEDRSYYWTSIMVFVAAGLFFALHFYPLLAPLQRYAFLGLLVVSLVSLLLHLFLSLRGSSDEQEPVSAPVDEVEEGGVFVSLLGYTFIYGPVLACLLIGAVRVPEVLRAMGLAG